MNAAVHAEASRQIGNVCRRLAPRIPERFAEDLEQEAWVAALANAKRFDAKNEGSGAFFYQVALLWCSEQVSRWRAVTSLSRDQARVYGDIEQRSTSVIPETKAETPDFAALLRQAQNRVTRLRIQWRREMERASASLDEQDRRVGFLFLGVNGRRWTIRDIARLLKISMRAANLSLKRFNQACRNYPAVSALWTAIERTEAEIP